MLVKTDRVDARVLARYGHPESTAPLHAALAELQHLALQRQHYANDWSSMVRLEQELQGKAAVCQLRARVAKPSYAASRP